MLVANDSFFHFKRKILNAKGYSLSEEFASIIFDKIKNYGLLHSGDVIA
jgi:hypothetical protein